MTQDPHRNAELYRGGAEVRGAGAVVVLLHGRGGSARDMLALGESFALPGVAYVAPAAAGSTWYPSMFMAERAANEPWLGSALARVQAVIDLVVAAGVAQERIVLCGFSQGACLATEFIASHALEGGRRYGGLIGYTGGLIGPAGVDLRRPGRLDGMPVFLGCGDPDPYIPWPRVEESAAVLTEMGAQVRLERYPGRSHTVSAEEIAIGRGLVEQVLQG